MLVVKFIFLDDQKYGKWNMIQKILRKFPQNGNVQVENFFKFPKNGKLSKRL